LPAPLRARCSCSQFQSYPLPLFSLGHCKVGALEGQGHVNVAHVPPLSGLGEGGREERAVLKKDVDMALGTYPYQLTDLCSCVILFTIGIRRK